MLLIRKSILFISFLIMSMPVLFYGIYGYAALDQFDELKNHKLKFIAETHVYITIIVFIFLIFMFFMLYMKSRDVYKKLDRAREILSYVSSGQSDLSNYLGRLGLLGTKINDIYSDVNKLNVMKTEKISSMSIVIKFLLENSRWSVIGLDPTGKALDCSKKLLHERSLSSNDVVESSFELLFSGVNFSEIVGKLKNTRDIVVEENVTSGGILKYEGDLIFYPIFSVSNQLTSTLCLLEHKGLVEQFSLKTEHI